MRPLFLLALVYLSTPAVAHASADMNAYVSSTYDYCDAKILAAMWQISASEAKSRIGNKLANGFSDVVASELSHARQATEQVPERRCQWYEMPFTYDDAVLLSKYWNSTPSESKTRAEEKAVHGGTDVIRQVLVLAKQAHPAE